MALENLEKILTNVVFLPTGDFEVPLRQEEISRILRDPELETGMPGPALRIRSFKEQIDIVVAMGRVEMRDHSDRPGSDRFVPIVSQFLSLLADKGVRFRAYGWNFDVAFDRIGDKLPAQMIADRFINKEAVQAATGIDLAGASLRLFYGDEGERWTLYLEPRGNLANATRFSAHANAHHTIEDSVPTEETLRSSFETEYDAFIKTLESLLA